ncbi:alpha/beta fold hydrolase [Actinomadura sp. J1-007]|nr:alpha/beta fold hydrolase [Actinomadura sp. J1-007]
MVCGAAFAATCISAVAVPATSQADPSDPGPSPSVTTTPPLVPSEEPEPGTGTPTGPAGTGSPTGPSGTPTDPAPPTGSPSTEPSRSAAPGTGSGGAATDGVVSASAVMVTPRPPRQATYAYGRNSRQRIDAYWKPVPGQNPAKPAKGAKAKAKGAKNSRTRVQAQSPARPKAKPRPAVLILHGGYWLEGDKGGWKYFARRLTAQGFTVFSANYRLAPAAAWPAQRNDAAAALAFIKKNAKRWNVDPGNIVVVGSSAGGMLATQLGAYGEGAQRVRGVVALSPPNMPYLAYQDGAKPTATPGQRKLRRAVVDLIRCVPSQASLPCWKRVDDANTTSHVSAGDAPMLLMHSDEDLVPATQSTGLATALRAAGVPATVKVVEGKLHASALMNDEHVYPTILSWLKAHTD